MHEEQKVVIGGLLNIADVHAKKVLAAYNPALSYNANLANVTKCNAAQLEACAKLVKIKVRSEDGKDTKLYKNKDILADRIILKIESLFEAECSDCNSTYQNSLDTVPVFTCRLCMLGSHDCEEIKSKAANIGSPIPAGFVWICRICLDKNNLLDMEPSSRPKAPQVSKKLTESSESSGSLQVIQEDTEEVDEHTEHTVHDNENERISPRRGRDKEPSAEQQSKRRDKTICELYKRRSCPHGRSGKTPVEGKTCQYRHPKRCFKFCDYGSQHDKGCNRGKNCQFWHPRLCKHSRSGVDCEIEDCTFQHLVFLKPRSRVESGPEGRTSYRRMYREERETREEEDNYSSETHQPRMRKDMMLPRVSLTPSVGFKTPYPPTINKPATQVMGQERKADQYEESFLFKLMEDMRAGFQEPLNELKEEIVKKRESRQHPVHNQEGLQQQPPVYRAFPGTVPAPPNHFHVMMAHQQAHQQAQQQAQQWINQSQGYPPFSS